MGLGMSPPILAQWEGVNTEGCKTWKRWTGALSLPFPSGWGKDVAHPCTEGISDNDFEIDPSNVDPQSDRTA